MSSKAAAMQKYRDQQEKETNKDAEKVKDDVEKETNKDAEKAKDDVKDRAVEQWFCSECWTTVEDNVEDVDLWARLETATCLVCGGPLQLVSATSRLSDDVVGDIQMVTDASGSENDYACDARSIFFVLVFS